MFTEGRTAGDLLRTVLPSLWQKRFDRLKASPVGSRIARGAFWSLFGAVFSRVLTVGMTVATARLLGKIGFGELAIIQSTIGTFTTFASFGLGITATKYVAECRVKDPGRAGRIIGVSTRVVVLTGAFAALAMLLAANFLATKTLSAPQLAPLLRLGAVLIFLSAVGGAQTGVLAGFEAFKQIAKLNLYTALVTLPLSVGGAALAGVTGALWGLITGAAVNCLMNSRALHLEARRAGVTITVRGWRQELSPLFHFTLPALISAMLAMPVNWVCNAMLVSQSGSFAEMAVLAVANQWYFSLLFLPGALAKNTLPILSERFGQGDRQACRRILRYGMGLNVSVTVPVAVIGCLASPLIMALYGKGFSEHWLVVVVALLNGAIVAVQIPLGQMTAASGRMWLETLMNLGWALLYCAATWALLSHGALGVTLARLIAYSVHTVWTALFVMWILAPRARQPFDPHHV